jgi:DNA-binding SARP family transcriptional activator/predicted ATPase/TolA-binding protein
LSQLSLFLLGSPRIERDGRLTTLELRKAMALLVYLAVTGQQQSKDTLATIFWPESGHKQARTALRNALYLLKKALSEECFKTDWESITLNHQAGLWIDMNCFQSLLAACETHSHPTTKVCPHCLPHLVEAVAHYKGDFLAGFSLADSPAFDEWQLFQSETLRQDYSLALDKLVQGYCAHGELETAITYARQWLAFNPLHEPAHRQLIKLYAQTGQRAAALRQYDECVSLLEEELGVLPERETTTLYEQIRHGEAITKTGQGATSRPVEIIQNPLLRHNLPAQPTAFIGRQAELAAISERLGNPACRLLTLIGLGGIGKSRLALQAAAKQMDSFQDGVFFVPLVSLDSAEFLDATIASALNFSFYGSKWKNVSTTEQLLSYLRDKQMLLLLDNFEHLLTTRSQSEEEESNIALDFLSQVLAQASNVKLLITSRECLHLPEEWLLEIRGLTYLLETTEATEAPTEAMQLFIQSAQRVQAEFAVSERERAAVVNICRLLEGMPLGIEMAAAWVRMLSCDQIASEIERSLDFLATPLRGVPQRHRSLRAVFDYSWHLLNPAERSALRQFSLFRGDFSREAAEQVAEVSLPLLLILVDKSLLYCSRPGRYEMHPVMRQYAAERLAAHPTEQVASQDRFAAFYADFLLDREERLKGSQQKEALVEVEQEIENIRIACDYIFKQAKEQEIDQVLESLFFLYEVRGWLLEGEEMFAKAVQGMTQTVPNWQTLNHRQKYLLARALVAQGRFALRLSQFEKAGELLEQCLAICEEIGEQRKRGYALNNLAVLAFLLGDYGQAREHLQQGLAIFREVDDVLGLAFTLYSMGNGALAAGNYPLARQLYEESLFWHRRQGYKQGIAISVYWLAETAARQQACTEAEQIFQESLLVRQDIEDRWGIAMSLNSLGQVAFSQGDYRLAEQHYQESLQLFREIGDRKGAAAALSNLGNTSAAVLKPQEAKAYLRQALQIALEIHLTPMLLDVLCDMGVLLAQEGEEEQVVQLLNLVVQHPGSDRRTLDKAEQLLAALGVEVSPGAVMANGEPVGKLEQTVTALL